MSAINRALLFVLIAIAFAFAAYAQESIPDADSAQTVNPESTERIVDGRPSLYTVKRVAHPLSWIEFGLKPFVRSAESGRIRSLMSRKPGAIRVGAGGVGVGSGFGPSVTYVNDDFLHRGIHIDVPLVYTYAKYQAYAANASVPINRDAFAGRLTFDVGALYTSRARDDFYGVGNDTVRLGETRYRFRTVTRQASAGFTLKLDEDWKARVGAAYRRVGVTKPTNGLSVQENFSTDAVPGLNGGTIGSALFTLSRDTTSHTDYAFKGSADTVEVSYNLSPADGDFRYWRLHYDSIRFIPLTSDRRKLIAARALVETNLTPNGKQVPFFDLPFLGANQTLRGFENFRFRDKSAVALTLEYRYRIWPSLDWGLFVDEGQVAPQIGDMAFNKFHTGYGTRFFIWANQKMPISIDYGRSRETWRLYINFNTSF